MKFEELVTERLRLRKLTPEVYDYVHVHLSENELMDFLALNSLEELAKEKEKYRKGLSTYNRSFLNFQMIDKATGQIIGACGFHTWYIEHSRAEIGYALLLDDYKEKGLMSEALKPILEYGFNSMNLHRIEAFVGPGNIPSLKLMEKMKFVREGQLREHYFKNDRAEDSIVFSLLKQEYIIG